MISPQLFQSLIMGIVKNGKIEQRRLNGTLYRICTLSELTLMLSQKENGKWHPEGVNMEIFDIELFFSSDGNIAITENDEKDDPDVYAITEEALIEALSNFLEWRVKTIQDLGV